jgi:hypothetical protein
METKMSGRGGKRRGAGRKKGVPNKLTANVREAVQNAFLEVGGENYLVKVAKEDPRTFCTLLGKILPTQVDAQVDQPTHYTFFTGVPRARDDEDGGKVSYTVMPDGQKVWPREN